MSLTLNGNRTGRAAASYNAEIRNQLSNDAMIESSKERARRAALCLEVSQDIRDMMTQEQYDAWWEAAPEVGYLEYAQAELARLQSIPNSVDLATSAEPVPDEEVEIADTLAMVGGEFTNFPTYDQLLNGAKFTDEHRAHVRQAWNEMYSDEVVEARIKEREVLYGKR